MTTTTTTTTATCAVLRPATDAIASQLLPPRRRRQIEIWLGETVRYEALQSCATDKRHGHASDVALATATTTTTTSTSPSTATTRTRTTKTKTKPAPGTTHCPVCRRYLTGEEPPTTTIITTTATAGEPPFLSSSSPSSPSPEAPAGSSNNSRGNKPRAVLRGLKVALQTSLLLRPAGRDVDEACDPALSTKMFSPVAPGGRTHGHTGGGGEGEGREEDDGEEEEEEEEEEADSFPPAARPGSSGDGDAAGGRLLNERMARLRRAQRLLDKSHQPKEKR